MTDLQQFDHVLIGTGQATGTLLARLLPTGDTIAVVESDKVGGSCVNYGCTPTKTLVASARAIHVARRGDEFGFTAGEIAVDYARVRARMNALREKSSDGLTSWIEDASNATLIRARGRFESDSVIRAGDLRLRGEHVYLNVGTRTAVPPIAGLDSVPWLDSAGLLDLDTLPRHLVIIGGGYIGVEFAQVFRRFGSAVTVLQRGDQLMPREEQDVADAIREVLEDEGVRIYTGADVRRVERVGGTVRVHFEHDDAPCTIEGSHLLLAAGRQSNADRLDLDKTSITTDARGFIEVDDVCRTAAPGVFALGDVNGHGAFTHTSVNDAQIALDELFGGVRRLSDRIPIYALFSDPPLGRVGMTRQQALAAGHRVLEATKPMAEINRAKEMGETKGLVRLLVDADTDLFLGATILGVGGDEVINMFAALMHANVPCHEYRRVVLVHPTVSELMPWILDDLT